MLTAVKIGSDDLRTHNDGSSGCRLSGTPYNLALRILLVVLAGCAGISQHDFLNAQLLAQASSLLKQHLEVQRNCSYNNCYTSRKVFQRP